MSYNFSPVRCICEKVIDDNNQAKGTAMLLNVSRTTLEIEVTDLISLVLLLGELWLPCHHSQ